MKYNTVCIHTIQPRKGTVIYNIIFKKNHPWTNPNTGQGGVRAKQGRDTGEGEIRVSQG